MVWWTKFFYNGWLISSKMNKRKVISLQGRRRTEKK